MANEFVGFNPYPGYEYGTGEGVLPDGRTVPMYDPNVASQFDKRGVTPVIGSATDIETPGKPVANGKQYESAASKFLASSGGKEGSMQTTPDGKMMVVEPHPAAPERGLATEHPGVTVREPKISAEENSALEDLTKKYPNLTKDGLLKMFQHEGGYDPNVGLNPGAVNPKSGAAGIFQLMPSQAKALGMGDPTKYSAADQIRLYDEYLKSHNAPNTIGDTDLGLAQAAPGFIGKPDSTLVYPSGSKEASLNPAWRDASGNVTVGSIKSYYGGSGGTSDTPGIQDLGNGNKVVTDTKNITSTTEGIPYSGADQAALYKRSEEHAQALKDAYAPVIDAQAALQKQQMVRQQEIQQMADTQADREQRARQAYDDSTARVQQATTDVLNDQAPAPFGGNAFAVVLASIAQGMGAYAAAINKTDNFAAKAIDAALNRTNEQWKQNLLIKQYKVKQLQDLNSNQWHDYKLQVSEREAQQRMLVDHEIQQQLAVSKNADTQKALGLILEDNRAKTEDLNAERERLARGKVMNETVTDRKVTQGAPVDEKTYQAYMKGEPHKGIYGRGAIDTAETEMQSLPSVLGLNFDPSSPTPFTDKQNGALDEPIARMPLTGTALGPTGIALTHPIDALTGGNEKRKEAYSRLQTVVNAKLYMVSGAQINEQEAARTAGEFKGLSREDMIRNLNMLWTGLQNKKADLEATYPGMSTVYDKRRPATSADPYAVDNQFTPGVK